jgi:uncharacterized membrane protein YidH (DUF202 family)
MSANLRISLTILSAGFAVEGAGELYSLLTAGSFLPGTSLLFLLPAVVTLLGLLFLLVGRHEWDENHRARLRRANLIFGLSLLAGVVATVEVVLLATTPSLGAPLWAEVLFGAAAGAFLFGTFATYAQLVFHLVTRPSKVALVASAIWALIVSIYVAQTLASDLPSILGNISSHSFSIGYLISPVDYLASFLFISYFLLLGAYVDAHVTVARRRAIWLGKSPKAPRSPARGVRNSSPRPMTATSSPTPNAPAVGLHTTLPSNPGPETVHTPPDSSVTNATD